VADKKASAEQKKKKKGRKGGRDGAGWAGEGRGGHARARAREREREIEEERGGEGERTRRLSAPPRGGPAAVNDQIKIIQIRKRSRPGGNRWNVGRYLARSACIRLGRPPRMKCASEKARNSIGPPS